MAQIFHILQKKQGTGTGNFNERKLVASDGAAGDFFGVSVSISDDGNTAVVGAYGDFTDVGNVQYGGSAYIFVKSGGEWIEQQKLRAPVQEGDAAFGGWVSISGDGSTVMIGANIEDTTGAGSNSGAAYVFVNSGGTWTHQQKLISSDIQVGDYFGGSVSLSTDGNIAIIGARGEDTGGSTAGAAYVFTRSGSVWTQQQKLISSDIEGGDYFGLNVSLAGDGNTAIIGAQRENSLAGAAYIFTRSGSVWTQQQKLVSADLEPTDLFGTSVSISNDGNTAVVGARLEDFSSSDNAGAAYIFTRSGSVWTQQQKLTESNRSPGNFFGDAVSISGDGNTVAIVAPASGAGGDKKGKSYIFSRAGSVWTEQHIIQPTDVEVDDFFATHVAIDSSGNTVIYGVHGADPAGVINAGAAYVYTI